MNGFLIDISELSSDISIKPRLDIFSKPLVGIENLWINKLNHLISLEVMLAYKLLLIGVVKRLP